ncbi:MAG: tRNA lysidine(34) synthetase TilS [Candidatus Brocadiales bacterium]
MKIRGFENGVRDTVGRHGLLGPGDNVVVGVSGGPDSVALLHALIGLDKSQGWGLSLHIAHVNHMLRGRESGEDKRFVRELAGSLGLECSVKEADVRELASGKKCSIETAARDLRYAFFEETAERISATRVAVGHTADDNAETVLHRIIRGTGLLGLGGIRPSRKLSTGSKIMLVRPLLNVWRVDVLSYLGEKELEYRTDSSNQHPEDNLRNRIRLGLLPLLEKEYNPQIKDVLTRLGDIAGRSNDFLESRITAIVGANLKWDEGNDACSFEANLLMHHPPFFQHFFLKEVLSRVGVSLGKMDYGHYSRIIEMVEGGVDGREIELPGGWVVRLEGEMLFVGRVAAPAHARTPLFEPVELKVPGTARLPDGREIRIEEISIDGGFIERFKGEKTPDEEVVDADMVAGEKLYVRTRREGERFWPLGVAGEKKLKDFFIDAKTPRWQRDDVLIVASDTRPVWVVGHRIDERVKITPKTRKVFKLSVH